MSQSIYDLSERQWVQVRAALRFWASAAEHSRTHPSRHPAVSQEFTKYGPLSLEEVVEIIQDTPKVLYMTATQVADELGADRQKMMRAIRIKNVQPDLICSGAKLFRTDRLDELRRVLHYARPTKRTP